MKSQEYIELSDVFIKNDDYDLPYNDKYSVCSDLDLVVEVDLSDRGTSSARWGTYRSRQSKYSRSLSRSSSTGLSLRTSSSKPQSRSRPIKENEVEPFLSIDTVSSGKNVNTELKYNFVGQLRTPGKRTIDNNGLKSNVVKMSAKTVKPAPSSAGPVLTAYFSSYKTMNSPSAHQRPSTRDQLSAMSMTSVRGYTTPYNYNTKKKTNYNIKAPFKHTHKEQVESEIMPPPSPSQDIKERTALATYHLKKVLSQEKQLEKKKVTGKLQKGKLKPMKPVVLSGPNMSQCKGILTDKKIHISNPSDTLKRRINIVNNLPDMKEYLIERPQTEESIHRTSAASSIDGNRDNIVEEDFVLDEEQIKNMMEKQLSLNEDVTPSSDIGETPRVPESTPRPKSSTPSATEELEAVNIVADCNEAKINQENKDDDSQSEGRVDTPEAQISPPIQIFIRKEKSLNIFSSHSDDHSTISSNSQKKRPHTACEMIKNTGKVVRFAQEQEKASGDRPAQNKTRPSTGGFTYITKRKDSQQKEFDFEGLMGQKKLVVRSCNPKSAFDQNIKKDDDPDDDKENRKKDFSKSRHYHTEGSYPGFSSIKSKQDKQAYNNNNTKQQESIENHVSSTNGTWCRKRKDVISCDRLSDYFDSGLYHGCNFRYRSCKSAPSSRIRKTYQSPSSLPTSDNSCSDYEHVPESINVRPSSAKVSFNVRKKAEESTSKFHIRKHSKWDEPLVQNSNSCHMSTSLLSSNNTKQTSSSELDYNTLENSSKSSTNKHVSFRNPSQHAEDDPTDHVSETSVSAFDALNSEIDAIIHNIRNELTDMSQANLNCTENVNNNSLDNSCETCVWNSCVGEQCHNHCYQNECMRKMKQFKMDCENAEKIYSVIGELKHICKYLKLGDNVQDSISKENVVNHSCYTPLLNVPVNSGLTLDQLESSLENTLSIDDDLRNSVVEASTCESECIGDKNIERVILAHSLFRKIISRTRQNLYEIQKLTQQKLPVQEKKWTENGEAVSPYKCTQCLTSIVNVGTNIQLPPGYVFYFAYGLDMNPDRLQTYIKRASVERYWGLLLGFKMIFNKKGVKAVYSSHISLTMLSSADDKLTSAVPVYRVTSAKGLTYVFEIREGVVKDAGCFPNIQMDNYDSVEGYIYVITHDELSVLDSCVGFPEHYQRETFPVLMSACFEDSFNLYCIPSTMYVASEKWICTDSPVPNEFALDQCRKNTATLTKNCDNHIETNRGSNRLMAAY